VSVNFMMSTLFANNRYINICHLPQGYARISICHKTKLKYFRSGVLVSLCDYEFVAALFGARCLFFLAIEMDKNTTYSPDILRVDQFTLLFRRVHKIARSDYELRHVRPFFCPH